MENEAELCELAERVPAGHPSRVIAAWRAGHENPDETARRQHKERSLTWWHEPDGMAVGMFRFPPELWAGPAAAIQVAIMRDRSTPRSMRRDADAPTPPFAVERPTIPQQRADAFIGLVNGGGANVNAEVVIHVRADGISLDDGTPIAGSFVERIAPESFIQALIHDAESRPINASGRHRHPYDRQKRVVLERDRCCVDCGSTEFIHYDHVPSFERSKRTLVDELRAHCETCHAARHEREGW